MPAIDPNLQDYGRRVTSQNDEDGILDYLSGRLLARPWAMWRRGFFVEIGVGPFWRDGKFADIETDGLQYNCRQLQLRGMAGVLIDANEYPKQFGVKREFVSALNVNHLLAKYEVPASLDLFSLDVDGQEFWIWLALAARPKLVVLEYNGSLDPSRSCTVQFDVGFKWDGTNYHGASLTALDKLARAKDYVTVYANGVNAFFVRADLVDNPQEFSVERVHRALSLHPEAGPDKVWVEV